MIVYRCDKCGMVEHDRVYTLYTRDFSLSNIEHICCDCMDKFNKKAVEANKKKEESNSNLRDVYIKLDVITGLPTIAKTTPHLYEAYFNG